MGRYLKYTVLFALVAVFLATPACSKAGDKIPITTSSDKAKEFYLQGRDFAEKLRFPEARDYFEKAVEEDPGFALAYLGLAQSGPSAKFFFDNLEKAKAAMMKASKAEQQIILGTEAGFTGNPARQYQIYQKLVEDFPDDERAHMLLGNYYFGQQEYDKAIEQYELTKKIDPKFSQLYNQMGYSHRFLMQYDQAEAAFKEYIKLIPDDPNPLDSYAELLMKIGKFEESIAQYRKALAVDPTFAASYSGIATNYNFLGDYEAARKAAGELLANAINDGQSRAAYFAMAVSYVDEGKLDMAVKEIENQMMLAQKINDAANIAGDLILIGNLYLEMDKPDEALLRYQDALKVVMDSDLSEKVKDNSKLGFLFNEALVALAKGDIDKAKANQEEYAAQARANTNRFQIWLSHELAGRIALKTGDYNAAIAEFDRANQQNTYNLYRKAYAEDQLGEKADAQEICTQIAEFNQLNNINYGLVRHKAQKMMMGM